MKTQRVLSSKAESTQEHQQDIVSSSHEKSQSNEQESQYYAARLPYIPAGGTAFENTSGSLSPLLKNPRLYEPANAPIKNQVFLRMQQDYGNQYVQRMLKTAGGSNLREGMQAKLKIGKPGDKYEREADRVAEQIMRMGEPAIPQRPDEEETIQTNPLAARFTPLVQRQVDLEEEKKKEEEPLQTKVVASRTSEVTLGLSAGITSMKGKGQTLPEGTRAIMEQRFGYDFSQVRVHADNCAAETTRGLNARAFTVGRDVAFAPGWNPESEAGRRLLAHELAHVMQQTGAEPGAGGTVSGTPVIQRDDGSGGVNETGRTSTQPPANQPATVMQRAEDEDDGLDFWELYSKAIMEQPHLMASKCQEYVNTIAPVLADLPKYDSFFDSVYDVYWGFQKLAFELLQMKKDSKTTDNQRLRANRLAEKWISIKEGMEAANYWRTKTRLIQAARATEQLRIQLTYAYGDIYHAGKEPEDVKVGSSNMKDLAEKGVDLLKVINEADAAITVRNVTPIIPVLEKTLTVVNLITGWKVTSSLASESQKGIAALQNAWNLANAGLSLGGFGKFLPLFGHIGPLLDGIAKGWARVVSKLREHNRIWWQLRDVLGEDVPYPDAFPGGREVLAYMKAVFRASHPLKSKPSKTVVDFFDDNREMFSRTAKEVLGKEWGDVPTRRSWLFWREVDPYELNDWVFYNREMTWRLIYGRDMDFPD